MNYNYKKEIINLIMQSIPKEIIEQVNIMGQNNGGHGNIVEQFYEKLFSCNNKMTREQAIESLVTTLVGAVGTVIVNNYLDSNSSITSRRNEQNLDGASADIVYEQEGKLHVVELKTAGGLIDAKEVYSEEYIDIDFEHPNSSSITRIPRGMLEDIKGLPSKEERQRYNGTKALKQLEKLCNYRDKMKNEKEVVVHVAYFENCEVSDILKGKFLNIGVELLEIPCDVDEVFNYVYDLIGYIVHNCENIRNRIGECRIVEVPIMPNIKYIIKRK